ncbi:MAG TPA: class I tRNA ligase family protein, partial [Candidatus Paceibacterota bacterium]|nr:class I tRNA ligase family protein [Candidatus Paceibacterota bacterium]
IKGQKHFANKLWNIARFVLSNVNKKNTEMELSAEDNNILQDWITTKSIITEHIENFRLHIAAEEIYNYIWKVFADKVLEESKPLLANDNAAIAGSRQALLYVLLIESLKTLHPFMPFVTECLWEIIGGTLPQKVPTLLMTTPWNSF